MLLGLQKSKGLFTDLGDNKIKVSTITFKLYGKHFIFLSFFLNYLFILLTERIYKTSFASKLFFFNPFQEIKYSKIYKHFCILAKLD